MRYAVALLLGALLTLIAAGCGPRAAGPASRGQIPTQQDLENMTYRSGFTKSGRVQLTHGVYQEPIRGNGGMLTVTLSPNLRLSGPLNERQDGAAVILRTVAGSPQRGEFYDLAAVVKTDTAARNVAIASLGDRIKVRSIVLEGNRIQVDLTIHAPRDPVSRPSLPVRRTYALQGQKLVLLKSEPIEE